MLRDLKSSGAHETQHTKCSKINSNHTEVDTQVNLQMPFPEIMEDVLKLRKLSVPGAILNIKLIVEFQFWN